MNSPWSDDHARAVREAAPKVPEVDSAELERAWLKAGIGAGHVPARRTSKRRVGYLAGVALAVAGLGLSGIAVAQNLSARTGEHNTDPESIELGGPGELIDPAGADFAHVLAEETADIPYPQGGSREIAQRDQRDEAAQEAVEAREAGERRRYVTGGLRAEAARQAVCAWANAWAAAQRDGDRVAAGAALEMLTASRGWPSITDIDAEQRTSTITAAVIGEDGVTRQEELDDSTEFAFLPRVVSAAQAGDVDRVGVELRDGVRCVPGLMGDLPRAVERLR